MSFEQLATVGIDKGAFALCFAKLAKAKRLKGVDSSDLKLYESVLAKFPQWAIEQAVDALMCTATFGFPTTDVWVQHCEQAVQRRLRDTLVLGREWKEECTSCHDSGWREYHCTQRLRCGRRFCDQLGEAHEHTYYSACACRAHNSTYRRQTLASQLGHGNAESKS